MLVTGDQEVQGMHTATKKPKIVVGVDGSPESDAALRLAYDEARVRHGELVVVHAWQYPPLGPSGSDRRRAEERLAESVERLGTEADPTVPITEKLIGGDARTALLRESQGAALLVIGSRGLGRVSSAVLGSVSTFLLHHATCPVEITPPVGRAAVH
jgi:nucleotide-binding universal stress UspA family protein